MLLAAGALAGVAGLSWVAWTRVVGALLLPAQLVYVLRQDSLEASRSDFLKRHRGACRLSLPVRGRARAADASATVLAAARAALARPWRALARLWRGAGDAEGPELLGNLDGVELPHPAFSSAQYGSLGETLSATLGAARPRYLLHLNANGVCYEERLEGMVFLQQALEKHGFECSMLAVNYRGVGASTGKTLAADDLVLDALAAVRFLVEERGADLDDIIIHGHSIGGGAAVVAAAELAQGVPTPTGAVPPAGAPVVLADRTFADLLHVVKDKLEPPLMRPIGAVMLCNAAILGFSVWGLGLGARVPHLRGALPLAALAVAQMVGATVGDAWPFAARLQGIDRPRLRLAALWAVKVARIVAFGLLLHGISSSTGPAAEYTALLSALGFLLGANGLLDRVAVVLVNRLGWGMRVVESWRALRTGRELATFHARDEMIPPALSLTTCADVAQTLELTHEAHGSPHMYDFFTVPRERELVIMRILAAHAQPSLLPAPSRPPAEESSPAELAARAAPGATTPATNAAANSDAEA